MSEQKIFAVAGRPILHSRSPQIFNSWFQSEGMNAVYVRLAAGSAEDAVKTARAVKLSGMNVTAPFKERIMDFLDGTDTHAARIGAVNCVVSLGLRLRGYNTDFLGAVHALKKNGVNPRSKAVAILGSGGAARAAAYGLKRSGASRVTLMNRTEERAQKASAELGCAYAPFEFADRVVRQSDIVISCIPDLPARLSTYRLKKNQVWLQADYRNSSSKAGKSQMPCRTLGGLEWLLHQAAPAFSVFTGSKLSARLRIAAPGLALFGRPVDKANIALVGFMGSGKSTIGRILSESLDWEFVDTDQEVERRSGMTVLEIFRKKGEPSFRQMEKSMIGALLPGGRKTVLALGGGALLDTETRSLVSRNCLVVWLWVSLEAALGRMDVSSRPILHVADPGRAAYQAFAVRRQAYANTSDLVLNTDIASPEEIARRIYYEIYQALAG